MARTRSKSAQAADNGARRPAMTRREMIRRGAAMAGGAVALGGGVAAAAGPAAPAVQVGATGGRQFRALVRHGTGLTVETLRLRPIAPRQVVIRSQAVAPCYTIVRGALATTPAARAQCRITAASASSSQSARW